MTQLTHLKVRVARDKQVGTELNHRACWEEIERWRRREIHVCSFQPQTEGLNDVSVGKRTFSVGSVVTRWMEWTERITASCNCGILYNAS